MRFFNGGKLSLHIQFMTMVFILLIWLPRVNGASIDVMLVYDTTGSAWVNSNGGMTAFSQDVVNRMNQVTQNSGLNLSFNLVHSMSVNYSSTFASESSFSGDLRTLQAGGDSLAAVHTARDIYSADLVGMLVDTGSASGKTGLGYSLTNWSGSPDYGFSVCAVRAVELGNTLTHEVGHNLGADHSKNQARYPGPNESLGAEYSAGWYFRNGF